MTSFIQNNLLPSPSLSSFFHPALVPSIDRHLSTLINTGSLQSALTLYLLSIFLEDVVENSSS